MTPPFAIEQVATWGMVIVSATMILCSFRLRKGPTLADRVLALDLMTTCMMGFFGLYALYSDNPIFVDVVIVFALVAFISTVVFARHIERDALKKAPEGAE